MREQPLPSGFEWLSGRVRYVHKSTLTEYASSCPNCGGDKHKNGEFPDRFRIFTTGKPRCWCRRCGVVIFPDMIDERLKPDYNQIRIWNEERERQYKQQKEQAEHALELLEKERKWLEWHDQMSEKARNMWENAGIPRDWQDYWKLGYVDSRTFYINDEPFTRPAATIPKFGFGWHVRNIDFRIENPPDNVGKYRPLANVPAAVYITTPDEKTWRDEVYVCEGSKKAMVVSMRTGQDLKQVVGIPSCNSWAGVDQELKQCGRVWVIMDPDATEWAIKLAKEIGKNARIVELPHKADDAIMMYGMTPTLFRQQLRQATKVTA